jgi:hypothetical protein
MCISPVVARQRLGKNVTAAYTSNNRSIVGRVVFYAAPVVCKESKRLVLYSTFYFKIILIFSQGAGGLIYTCFMFETPNLYIYFFVWLSYNGSLLYKIFPFSSVIVTIKMSKYFDASSHWRRDGVHYLHRYRQYYYCCYHPVFFFNTVTY